MFVDYFFNPKFFGNRKQRSTISVTVALDFGLTALGGTRLYQDTPGLLSWVYPQPFCTQL
jgi:hypothetical protein